MDTATQPHTHTDPVCGMKVDPQKAAAQHDHDGQTYYFCSTHCAKKFSAEPASYIKPKQEESQSCCTTHKQEQKEQPKPSCCGGHDQ